MSITKEHQKQAKDLDSSVEFVEERDNYPELPYFDDDDAEGNVQNENTLIPTLGVHPDEKTLSPSHSQIPPPMADSDESDLPNLSPSRQEKIDQLIEYGKRLVTPAQVEVDEEETDKRKRKSHKDSPSKKRKITEERKVEGEKKGLLFRV